CRRAVPAATWLPRYSEQKSTPARMGWIFYVAFLYFLLYKARNRARQEWARFLTFGFIELTVEILRLNLWRRISYFGI
ncbi:MAG: hypothetical protein J6J78_10485, partial [Clostridia bacterium]|nr:hypothetical protein [Clostridia bacterium]